MARKYKQYYKDFKLELVTQHGYSYAEAARQLGLEDWAVRAEVWKLRMENEILKKATAYFANDIV